jgi:hypothetical protein
MICLDTNYDKNKDKPKTSFFVVLALRAKIELSLLALRANSTFLVSLSDQDLQRSYLKNPWLTYVLVKKETK